MNNSELSGFKAAQAEVFESSSFEVEGASAADIVAFEKDVFSSGSGDSFASQIVENFSNYSEGVATKKIQFESALSKASDTGRPEDVLAATKAMGDYQLQVLLATKVASKSSSAIDKLTNLQ